LALTEKYAIYCITSDSLLKTLKLEISQTSVHDKVLEPTFLGINFLNIPQLYYIEEMCSNKV